MATQTVTQSVANAANGSFAYEMAVIVNALSALANEVKADLNLIRNVVLNRAIGLANFEIDTNFDVQNGDAFEIIADGELVLIATDQSFDTGTATTIATDAYWGAFICSIDGDATTHVDWGAEAVSEAAAILNLAAVTASGAVVCGYVTVHAKASEDFVAGTDALTSGTGGQVAQATNYYNLTNIGDAAIAAATSSADADVLAFQETGTPS